MFSHISLTPSSPLQSSNLTLGKQNPRIALCTSTSSIIMMSTWMWDTMRRWDLMRTPPNLLPGTPPRRLSIVEYGERKKPQRWGDTALWDGGGSLAKFQPLGSYLPNSRSPMRGMFLIFKCQDSSWLAFSCRRVFSIGLLPFLAFWGFLFLFASSVRKKKEEKKSYLLVGRGDYTLQISKILCVNLVWCFFWIGIYR